MYHHPFKQGIEISLLMQMPVDPKTKPIQIALQIPIANFVINAPDPAF